MGRDPAPLRAANVRTTNPFLAQSRAILRLVWAQWLCLRLRLVGRYWFQKATGQVSWEAPPEALRKRNR